MYCDNCNAEVEVNLMEHLKHTGSAGNLLCAGCRGKLQHAVAVRQA